MLFITLKCSTQHVQIPSGLFCLCCWQMTSKQIHTHRQNIYEFHVNKSGREFFLLCMLKNCLEFTRIQLFTLMHVNFALLVLYIVSIQVVVSGSFMFPWPYRSLIIGGAVIWSWNHVSVAVSELDHRWSCDMTTETWDPDTATCIEKNVLMIYFIFHEATDT